MKTLLAALMIVVPVAAAQAESAIDARLRKGYIDSCLRDVKSIAYYRARNHVLAHSPVATPENVRMIDYLEKTAGAAAREQVRASAYATCVSSTRPLEELKIISDDAWTEFLAVAAEYEKLMRRTFGGPDGQPQ
jgi:hypothetical protein